MGPLIVHSIAFRREYMLIVRIAIGGSHQLLGSDVIDLMGQLIDLMGQLIALMN